MVIDLVKIDERQMLRDWAVAEIDSTVYHANIEGSLPQEIGDKVKKGNNQFDEVEWQILEEVIKSFRSPLLNGLIGLATEWYAGRFPTRELGDIEMISWPPFTKLKGSNKLIDLTQAFQDGEMPLELSEFNNNLQRMRARFRFDQIKGRIIIVSQSQRPTYYLVEGYKRSCDLPPINVPPLK